jgi:hypothetical protein
MRMNRKEMTCAAVGAVLSAAGCSPATKSLSVPDANAETAASIMGENRSAKNTPHVTEVLLSLISGTNKDISSAVFRLSPNSGWSIVSSDPRLEVELDRGHVAAITAPQDEKVHFVAYATISNVEGFQLLVRCHVEASC